MTEKYIDEDEKKLLDSYDKVVIAEKQLPSKDLQEQIKASAKEFVKKETKMNIRIDPYELEKIKATAEQEGLKYQTFVKSVLHRYITGQLIDKRQTS